jgi:hypothetical protein
VLSNTSANFPFIDGLRINDQQNPDKLNDSPVELDLIRRPSPRKSASYRRKQLSVGEGGDVALEHASKPFFAESLHLREIDGRFVQLRGILASSILLRRFAILTFKLSNYYITGLRAIGTQDAVPVDSVNPLRSNALPQVPPTLACRWI